MKIAFDPPRPIQDLCVPSPCGPYSTCRVHTNHPVCSCASGYIGSPPYCRPECVISSECPMNQACVRQKCIDPCPGTCGTHSKCNVINHNPICSCPDGQTGDPFIACFPIESKNIDNTVTFFSIVIVKFI